VITGYEAGTNSVASPGAGAAAIELRAPTRRLKVRELGVFSQAATAVRFQLGRPAAQGITPGTTTLGQAQDPAEAAGTGIFSASWGTPPTAPAVALRQADFNNVVGSGLIWTWPSDGELVVPTAGVISVVIWCVTAGPTMSVYSIWGE
jgi:hypothetical protein